MVPLIQSLRLIVFFQVSILLCGLPFEHGASSSNSYQKLRQSCKSIKQKCTNSVRSGLKRLNPFGSTSTGPEARVCSLCSTAISDRHDVFKWPTCVEGHAVHRDCADPRSIAASSCPICQAVVPSIQRQVEHQEELKPEPDRCSICLEHWGDDDARITWPSCTHFFHESCLERWRQSNVACPLCREVDQTLLENRAASEATEQQITYNTIFAPLRDAFLRRLAEDGNPANSREAEEVAHLRNFFQREDAHYRN